MRDAVAATQAEARLRSHADALPEGHAVRSRVTAYLKGLGALTLESDRLRKPDSPPMNAAHQVGHVVVLRFGWNGDHGAAQSSRRRQDAMVVDHVPARLGDDRDQARDQLVGGEEESRGAVGTARRARRPCRGPERRCGAGGRRVILRRAEVR